MRILTAEAMREVDRVAIEELGIPGVVLMENAAQGVVEATSERFPGVRRVALLCGPGNNGGDGFAVARLLAARGVEVEIFLLGAADALRGDAATQRDICLRMGLGVELVSAEEDLAEVAERAGACDLVVDALFGTGLSRPLSGLAGSLVEALGGLAAPVVAVDLPSGLTGSSGRVPGPHLRADLTVTFAAPKVAHLVPPAAEAVGEVVVAELGIPWQLVEGASGSLFLEQRDGLARLVGPRRPDTHKGTYGRILVLAGSPGHSGAAVLAVRGALRAGAGLVTAAVPATVAELVDAAVTEGITLALEAGADGAVDATVLEALVTAAGERDVLAVGPGLGTGSETRALVRRLAARVERPLVIDADGIGAFAGEPELLRQRPGPTVLTPHPGEMARLLGWETARVVAERLEAVLEAAARSGAHCVLKGWHSLVATPGGTVYVNPTGNAGMATAGAGDVLTGVIAGLLGQGFEAGAACRLGVYLHGSAGDLAAEAMPQASIVAGDLVDSLPAAWRQLERG